MYENNSSQKKTEIILDKILGKIGDVKITEFIEGNIKPRELQTILLEMYQKMVGNFEIDDITNRYNSNRFVQPSKLSSLELINLDCLAYNIIPEEFAPIELSPVNPLGLNAVLAKIDQKNIMSAVRNVEVSADATTALTLECARRRKSQLQSKNHTIQEVNLCASQRSIRLQKFPENSGFMPHFKIFAICTASKDSGNEEFESRNLKKHIEFYLNLLQKLNSKNYHSYEITVLLSDVQITEKIIKALEIDRKKIIKDSQLNEFNYGFKPFGQYKVDITRFVDSVEKIDKKTIKKYGIETQVESLKQISLKALKPLKLKYLKVNFRLDLQRVDGIGYYENLCFSITARNNINKQFSLVDGGLTNWTKLILHNNKEKLLISGFGSELFCANFKK